MRRQLRAGTVWTPKLVAVVRKPNLSFMSFPPANGLTGRRHASQQHSPIIRRMGPAGSGDFIFSEKEVPPADFWESALQFSRVDDLTVGECHRAADVYCSIATRLTSTWKAALGKKHAITPYTLHYMATMLLGGQLGPYRLLGLHMLGTASDLGYDPSTLSLVHLVHHADQASAQRIRAQPFFRRAESRFAALVREGRHPDALTLKGIMLAPTNEADALQCFDRAIKVGGHGAACDEYAPKPPGQPPADEVDVKTKMQTVLASKVVDNLGAREMNTRPAQSQRPYRWNWEASCHLGRGRILLARGFADAAESAFATAALALDNPAGYLELGKLQRLDTPEREEYLTKAAISGEAEAATLLGELHLHRARQQQTVAEKKASVSDHVLMAASWFEVAGEAEKAAEWRARGDVSSLA